MLLDFQLCLEALFVALATVLGDLGGEAVHALQFGDLLAAPALEVAVEVGLQRERDVEAASELVVEAAATLLLGPAQLLGQVVYQLQLLPQRLRGQLVGVGEGGLLAVDLRRPVDEPHDGPADLVGLERLLGVLVDVVVGLDELELLVLVEQLELVDGGQQVDAIDQFLERLDLDVALVAVDEVGAVVDDALLELGHVLVGHLVEDLVLEAAAVADQHVGDGLAEVVAGHAVLLVELAALVGLVLHELLLGQPHRLRLVGLAREVGLRVLDRLLEVLEGLLVGVDEHLVVELEAELHAGDHAQVEGQVAVVAAHAVEQVDQLHAHLADLDGAQHLLELEVDGTGHEVLGEDGLEEEARALLEQRADVGVALVELDAEEGAEVLERLFLVGEHVVPVGLLHVVVLEGEARVHCLRPLLEVLAEGAVVGAADDVHQLAQGSVSAQLGAPAVGLLAGVLLGDGVEWPVSGLEAVAVVEAVEVGLDVLVDPYFLKHCVEFLLDIDVVLEAQLDLLLALEDLLVLVLEEDGAEVVELGHEADELRLVPQLNGLEEVGQHLVVALQQFEVDCRIERQVEGQLLFLYSEDVVDEGVDVLLLDEVAGRHGLQLLLEQLDHLLGLPEGHFLHALPLPPELLLVLDQQVQPVRAHQVLVLRVERVEVAVEDVPAEVAVARIDQQVVAVDVAEPAVLLVEVLVDRLPVLVDGDGLAAERVGLLEVVLAAEAVRAADGHLHLLVDEVDPAAHEAHLLLGADVVQPLHDQVLLVLQVDRPVVEELVQQVPRLRLVGARGQPLHLVLRLVAVLDGLLEEAEEGGVEVLLDLRVLEGEVVELLVEVLLGVEVEVVVLLALVEELLLHAVLAAAQVLLHLELLRPQLVHQLDVPLEKVL